MKTIKIIDLLNKMANGEEAPRLIRINGFNFRFISYVSVDCFYAEEETTKYWFDFMSIDLNDESEILDGEDEFKDIEELNLEQDELVNNKDIRPIDYLFEGTINQLIKNQMKIIERLTNEN